MRVWSRWASPKDIIDCFVYIYIWMSVLQTLPAYFMSLASAPKTSAEVRQHWKISIYHDNNLVEETATAINT